MKHNIKSIIDKWSSAPEKILVEEPIFLIDIEHKWFEWIPNTERKKNWWKYRFPIGSIDKDIVLVKRKEIKRGRLNTVIYKPINQKIANFSSVEFSIPEVFDFLNRGVFKKI